MPRVVSAGVPVQLRPHAPARSAMRPAGRVGDRVLLGLCALAGLLALAVLVEMVYQVVHGAGPAISKFGIGFLGHTAWRPNFGVFGALVPVFGTIVSSLIALALAAPLGIAIAIYLGKLAPRSVRAVVGPLVEMLAAIPSVILGFWGLIVLAPFLARHVEPWLHSTFGFIPIFGHGQTTGLSIFTAGIVLSVMVVPIVASLSRDLFLTVPTELEEGAEALGATRWEVIRGVVLPSTASGVAAAIVLGLGRALGETIAVAQVIGAGNSIHSSLFETGSTLASRIALEFPNFDSPLHTQALFYLAVILLAIGVVTNLVAQAIARRFDVHRLVAL
jgi:phosphate transport system permease protein